MGMVMKDEKWKKRASELLSEQLRIENFAFYFYFSAYQYCNSRSVATPAIAHFFYKQYNEELTHAKGIIDYCNQMGIPMQFKDIKLDRTNYKSLVEVFELSLKYEELATAYILKCYTEAEKSDDYAMTQFLDAYVQEQVQSEKEFSDFLVNAKRCTSPFEIFNFNAEFKRLAKKYKPIKPEFQQWKP